jgi:hypothetical protein
MNHAKPYRSLHVAFLLCFVCTAIAMENVTVDAETREFLLASAASDFTVSEGNRRVEVRDVHLRYQEGDDGTMYFMLCGQFQSTGEGRIRGWSDFATIKTEGYEQWLGSQAKSHCLEAKRARTTADLSAELNARLPAR